MKNVPFNVHKVGIINNNFRLNARTDTLSIVQYPLFQGNEILIIIHKPLNSGRNKLFCGNNNDLMGINAYPSNNCINLLYGNPLYNNVLPYIKISTNYY